MKNLYNKFCADIRDKIEKPAQAPARINRVYHTNVIYKKYLEEQNLPYEEFLYFKVEDFKKFFKFIEEETKGKSNSTIGNYKSAFGKFYQFVVRYYNFYFSANLDDYYQKYLIDKRNKRYTSCQNPYE